MSKIARRIIKLGRVVKSRTVAGRTYLPRITVSGSEITDLGWEYEDRLEVLIDKEAKTITIRKVE